ncbi:FkbM family methyltransferase [Flavobacteriaceae bacterium]|nr:FkbM family methyltransferase [Flavobacteriaceae bacterium]
MILKLYSILKFIYSHPFNSVNKLNGVLIFIKWQINCLLNPYLIIYQFTENAKLIVGKGLTGATGNLYCGLMEYNEMGFLLHFLRRADTFVDIGANVGSYTILASSQVKANSISIEPIQDTYKTLMDNVLINKVEQNVKAFNIGLGSEISKIHFTKSLDTINHVATKEEIDTIEVKIDTLDNLLMNEQCPSLIKIDVEGYENEVINGAEKTLGNQSLKAIIIELNGSGSRYGYDDENIHLKLLQYGFKPYCYNPKGKELKALKTFGNHNTLYLRDVNFIEERIKSSKRIKVGVKKYLV